MAFVVESRLQYPNTASVTSGTYHWRMPASLSTKLAPGTLAGADTLTSQHDQETGASTVKRL